MIWWAVAALSAFFIKGLCGFANTLIFTTILSFNSSNLSITPVELLLGFPTNLIIAWRERRSINWRICIPLTILMLAGNLPGIFLLKNTDSRIVKVFFGTVIVLIGAEMLLREYRPGKTRGSKAVLVLIGVMSGILSGMYGIGAMLAAYVGRVTKDSHSFKANMCAIFLVENIFRLTMYLATGIITLEAAIRAAWLFPVMRLGLWGGIVSGNLLDERLVKKLVILMLILSGTALVLTNLVTV